MPNQKEIATIEVGGTKYEDWQTISVEVAYPGVHRTAVFTVSEGNPPAKTRRARQISTGDECTVSLGGKLILTGYVVSRQTFADGNNHAVLIEAYGKPSDAVRTSVIKEKGQWRDKTIVDIAKEVYGAQDINVVTKGKTDNMNIKFEDVQLHQGESPFHLVERLARARMVWIGDDKDGNLVLDGGTQTYDGPSLTEGENIQWLRVSIRDVELMKEINVYGQSYANDDKWGREASESKAKISDDRVKRNKPFKLFLERPGSPKTLQKDVQIRAQFEKAWRASTAIEAEVGVQGWFKPGGGDLWEAGPQEPVRLNTAMGMVNQLLLIQKVVFKQDDQQGTMTILTMVDPLSFNGAAAQFE